MVVISMLTVVLGMVGVLFHRLFQAELMAAKTTVTEVTTMRLADQFRRDIHEASTVKRSRESGDTAATLEVNGRDDTMTVLYTAEANKVRREVKQQQTVVARETYRLPGCRVTFPEPKAATATNGDAPSQQPALVTLYLERPHATVSASNQAKLPLRGIVIDAELGRDHRLAASISRTPRDEEAKP
eukprot:TRINITY_DN512_c0_g1_i1.p1 TRINITY_DN512_c0_g1~~TRINITY_DN512_c0_g1_i1.p1  ORF type:complete len:186 (+),score=48.96 TRINITY_DN512_c0_g1_i1:466-1023(+)